MYDEEIAQNISEFFLILNRLLNELELIRETLERLPKSFVEIKE